MDHSGQACRNMCQRSRSPVGHIRDSRAVESKHRAVCSAQHAALDVCALRHGSHQRLGRCPDVWWYDLRGTIAIARDDAVEAVYAASEL